jgi:hypothetical protein
MTHVATEVRNFSLHDWDHTNVCSKFMDLSMNVHSQFSHPIFLHVQPITYAFNYPAVCSVTMSHEAELLNATDVRRQYTDGHPLELFRNPPITFGSTNKNHGTQFTLLERALVLLEALQPQAGCNTLVYTVLGEQ